MTRCAITRFACMGALAACLAASLAAPVRAASAGAADPPIVQVLVTQQTQDPFLPWQNRRPESASGYGVRLPGNRVLTTEHLVRSATHIDLMLPRSGALLAARVLAADAQANLAMLICDDARLAAVEPAVIAEGFARDGRLAAVQLADSREIQSGDAHFVRAHYTTLPSAPHGSLVFDVLTDLSVNGQGAPVFRGGELFGLIMTHNASTRIAAVLPAAILRRFVERVETPPYSGFASAGFIWRALAEPATRRWLGLERDGGVLVLACIPGAGAAQALQPNDVILAWDGNPIDELGYYDDPDLGRMLFPFLIKGRRMPGETASVRILSRGETLDREIVLARADEDAMLIPDNTEAAREPYLVEGGLVFRELTGRFIQSHGQGWERGLDSYIGYLYASRRFFPEEPGDRIVLISRVLQHPINAGYENIDNRIVTAVNGRPVRTLGCVFAARDADGSIHRITLRDIGVDLVLDRERIGAANAELTALYRMPNLEWRRSAGPEDLPGR